MTDKNKKIFATIGTSALAVLMLSLSAIAYFTSNDKATNTITVAKNDISIVESDFSTPDSIYNGQKILKTPIIKAKGADCYVRVFCEISDSKVDYAKLNFNTTDWTEKQPDGYYYYKHKLKDGEETKPLFTQVKIENKDDTDSEPFDIIVYSESAQAYDTYHTKEFADYKAAWDFWSNQDGSNIDSSSIVVSSAGKEQS